MTTIPEVPLTHTERARLALEHIRGIKELIEGFTFDTEPDLRSLNTAKSVPDAFLEELAVAIEASEPLANASQVQPPELRDTVGFSQAFRPVDVEMGIVHRAMKSTIARKRGGVCRRALQTYHTAKGFARKTDRPLLMVHLDAMKNALRKSRSKPAPVEPDPLEPILEPLPPKKAA